MRRRVRTGQLVVAEVTGAAVIASLFAPRWVLAAVAALAAAVLVATFGRAGGRWWWEAVALGRRFRRRRSRAASQVVIAAVETGTLPVPVAWLRTLAPALAMRPVAVGTQTVAVGSDMDGWFGVAEVGSLWGDEPMPTAADPPAGQAESPWAPASGPLRVRSGSRPVPYRDLLTLLDQVSAVQVVLTAGPYPGEPRPAWVAVRITPGDALATERTGGVSGVERTIASAVAKAVRTLESAGWAARPVGADGLVPALIEATGLDGPPQEQWSWWRTGRTVRTHYALTGWTPAHGTLAPGVTQLAVCCRRGGEPLERAVVVAAVTAAPAALRRVCQEVVTAAAAQGVRLQRLDGEQAPAVWATAPTASLWISGRPNGESGS